MQRSANFSIEFELNCMNEAKKGVLIDRMHYYALLSEEGVYYSGGLTNRGVALTEGVPYLDYLISRCLEIKAAR